MNDTQRCPACGASNQCGLADPRSATQGCWCFTVQIDPTVLEALPDELRDKACLCPRCAAVDEQLKAIAQKR
ncbi:MULTISPECIES: cysteine-rich CWC family protein [unclassified Pseudomonas]|uniref:cysteine-rich CWC family protein n=1 Tax=unclassified Pseudomonas TaxID=196821 RepID=UPI0035C18459